MSNLAVVYFMEAAGLIKIGYSTDLDARWAKINLASPVPVDLIGCFAGTPRHEQALHAQFAHLRQRGEWFTDTPELRAEIERRIANPDLCECGGEIERIRGRYGSLKQEWLLECSRCSMTAQPSGGGK